ncbi:dynamin family protein [Helicobacter pylori]|uniref:dynamin family protein n=1 Tax=Helicobacter pylori TaxID=210 RepID=UPI001FD28848|nr:dynamin family protein [Helicobacter pylori]UOR80960.1 dynamin family protein [Helicobacter pylori]
MNAQELIQNSVLIEKVIKEQGLQEKAGPFISENAVIKTEKLEKTIKGMQAENRGLKFGIIGRVKAGKSSLLNALIFEGKDVLPKAATTETSSLIILKYAQNLSTQVEFYSQKDILELKNEHERYEKKFKEIVSEEIKNLEEKQQGLLNKTKEKLSNFSKSSSRNKSDEEAPKQKILSPEEIRERAQKIAKNELNNDAKLTASHDQYERMKKSGLINPKDLETCIQADSLEELNQKLYQFVGKEGKFMPYTKAVQISLNNPNLKDLEFIDTPGVNDPIVSRETRTKALLKECDVVFVIIPSGNFLTDSDMDLFDRVSNKEGIQRVYFVASQADSAVCAPSEVENSRHHLPTALTNTQKILSSSLNATMSLLKKKYPHQQEIFESAIKNGVILTSGVCYNLYKDLENQASWEREKEEYQLAWENLTNDYPDAFSSHEARENLKRLSNIDAIRERLEEAAKEKENIISQRLQEYLKSQANNLSSLVANLLRELESEKNRIKDADLNKISEQLKEYEKLSDKIETDFKDTYEKFVIDFIKETEDGLDETLKEFIENAKEDSKKHEGEREDDDIRSKRVEEDGVSGSIKRLLGGFFGWGYEEKQYAVKVTRKNIKAGVVVDLLIKMHDECAKALNRDAESFKKVFKEKLYEKILSKLCEIIQDNGLIDKYAFKKSVNAVTDKIKFEEFDYADMLPSEIRGQTGFLEGDEANQFIKSVESYVRDFKGTTKNDVKDYIKVLKENLKDQNFAADVHSKLVEEMQNLRNQVGNKAQSIDQIEGQIKALKEI